MHVYSLSLTFSTALLAISKTTSMAAILVQAENMGVDCCKIEGLISAYKYC